MKNLFIYISLFFFIISCSNEELIDSQITNGNTVNVCFNLSVPDPEIINTRAVDESGVNEACLLVFDKTSGLLKEFKVVSSVTNNKFEAKLTARDNSSLYLIANANSCLSSLAVDVTTLADVKSITNNSIPVSTIIMWAKGELTTILAQTNPIMTLSRVMAKVTVEKTNGVNALFALQNFKVKNIKESGSILPDELTVSSGAYSEADFIDGTHYVYPSANSNTHIVIKATYDGNECYYRINLKDNSGLLSIQPNYHYQIIITSVFAAGYANEALASADADGTSGITYLIDSKPLITNMVTNGSYELGVCESVYLEWNNSIVRYAYVGTINNDNIPTAQIISTNAWLTIGTAIEDDTNTADGKLYKYLLTPNDDNKTGGTREIEITFTLGNLTKKLLVYQYSEDLLTAHDILISSASAPTITSQNYWTFLSVIDGIQSINMQGLERNKGLHFSTINNNITYTVDKAGYMIKGTPSDAITVQESGNKILVTSNSNKPAYGVIKNGLVISNGLNTISFDLYFTGVFHNETGTQQLGGSVKTGWFYYETIPCRMSNGTTITWFDRNLAATSNGFHVKDKDGSTLMGDANASGGTYWIGKIPSNNEVTIQNPCPAGFEIPTEQDYTSLEGATNSYLNFSFENSYWRTYLNTGYNASDGLLEKIYFTKELMWYDNAIKGTALNGYYWTCSKAIGVTGDERGYWMRYAQIGNSIQYNHFRIWTSGNTDIDKRSGMSVRCIKRSGF